MSGRLWLRSPFESLRVSGKVRISFIERPLDGDGALQRLRRRAKRGHEAVAHGLHLRATVRLQRLPHDALVLAQPLPRPGIAEALCHGRGALDVREEDGAEGAGF